MSCIGKRLLALKCMHVWSLNFHQVFYCLAVGK